MIFRTDTENGSPHLKKNAASSEAVSFIILRTIIITLILFFFPFCFGIQPLPQQDDRGPQQHHADAQDLLSRQRLAEEQHADDHQDQRRSAWRKRARNLPSAKSCAVRKKRTLKRSRKPAAKAEPVASTIRLLTA